MTVRTAALPTTISGPSHHHGEFRETGGGPGGTVAGDVGPGSFAGGGAPTCVGNDSLSYGGTQPASLLTG